MLCVAIWRDSVSPFRFHFRSHVLVFLIEFSSIYRLKYPYSCFSYQFRFLNCLQFFVIFLFVLSVLLLTRIIFLSLLVFMLSSCLLINAFTLSSMLASPLPPFLDSFSLCHLSEVIPCPLLYILGMVPSILQDEISAKSLVFRTFLVRLRYSFVFCCLSLFNDVYFEYYQVLVIFLFSKFSDSFLTCQFFYIPLFLLFLIKMLHTILTSWPYINFLANNLMWFIYIRWLIFFCDLVNLYASVQLISMLVWFVWFYGISTMVGYLTPNPFLCK